MLENQKLSLLVFIAVVSEALPLHFGWAVGPYGPNSKKKQWTDILSTEQFSTSFRRRHCFVSFYVLKSVKGVCSQGNRNNMSDDEINVL